MPNFEELFDSTVYIKKSKMYRNYVWATETEIFTLTAILGITLVLLLAGLDMEPRSCMAFLVILIHLLCICSMLVLIISKLLSLLICLKH